MELNIQGQPQPLKSTGAATSTARATADSDHTISNKASNTANAVKDLSTEIIDQVKLKAGETYDQANKKLNKQYEKALGYGRENLGITTLLIFGVGVSVGALLVSNVMLSRNRRGSTEKPSL